MLNITSIECLGESNELCWAITATDLAGNWRYWSDDYGDWFADLHSATFFTEEESIRQKDDLPECPPFTLPECVIAWEKVR